MVHLDNLVIRKNEINGIKSAHVCGLCLNLTCWRNQLNLVPRGRRHGLEMHAELGPVSAVGKP